MPFSIKLFRMSNNKSAIAIFRVHQDHEQSREITVQFLYLAVRFVIPPFLPLFSLHCSFPPFLFPVFNSIHVVARVLRPGFRALSPPVSRSILITSHCLKMPTRIYLLPLCFVGEITNEPLYGCFWRANLGGQ